MKKILIIQANPKKDSYCHSLAESYQKGAMRSGAEIQWIELCDLKFNISFDGIPVKEIEPDLIDAQERYVGQIILCLFILRGGQLFQLCSKGFSTECSLGICLPVPCQYLAMG